MGLPLAETGYILGRVVMRWVEDKNQELSFGHSKFELLVRHPSAEGEDAVKLL